MARQIVVLFFVFFAVVGLASAAIDPHASSAAVPAEGPLGDGSGNNVIGTTDGGYNSDAAPVGGPVPAGAFHDGSPAESPKSTATTAEVTSVAGVVAAAVAGSFFF
ncbi:anther-specific protein BCP1 [Forsythia ovata]|uniref:Anther-specific protein BCP1 n=1 Tax=Forsythia ovata TaxID=205694 RepID=A0ABD1TC56_9LAMI